MTGEAAPPHFIQHGDDPVLVGEETGDLSCGCGGSILVRGCEPAHLLGLDIRCARCGAVTSTAGLAADSFPPANVMVAERRTEALGAPVRVPRGVAVVSREELTRLTERWGPRTPPSDRVRVNAATLDEAEADYDRLTGGGLGADLAAVAENRGDLAAASSRGDLAAGSRGDLATAFRRYPLAWALGHLRAHYAEPGWVCAGTNESSVAGTLLGAFRHFLGCWSHHPLFPAMAAAAAERRFSFHALALFGAAKCLTDAGNRVIFRVPEGQPGKVTSFDLALNARDRLTVLMEVYDRHEWPALVPWDVQVLGGAMTQLLAASQGRINRRRPGMLVISPGAVPPAFDQAIVDALKMALAAEGRRNRGASAMAAILPKHVATGRPDEVQFGYGFYPIPNRFSDAATVVTPPELA